MPLLARYYFLNNANIWLWFLYGNDEVKGWELFLLPKSSRNLADVFSIRCYTGEIGLSYHHRNVGPDSLDVPGHTGFYSRLNEDRIGMDGKWDIGPGVWFEEVLKHR